MDIAGLLSPDNLAFIQQGVSINVASRDLRRVPSLTRALGCRVDEDGKRLRIALARSQGVDLLRDIGNCRTIAVVFTQPSTHRTLQIKGQDAEAVPPLQADRDCVKQSGIAFGADLLLLGFDATFTEPFWHVEPDDLVVLAFTPRAVFQQTPGPNAGSLLGQLP